MMGGQMGEHESLAALLAPRLIDACERRLSPIQWFRSAWQAGGASTGYATYTLTPSRSIDVVVKLPVGPSEYRWTTRLSRAHDSTTSTDQTPPPGACTPWVLASGTELGGYDLAWLVIEKMPGTPLSSKLDQTAVEDLLLTAVRWYVAAAEVAPIDAADLKREDWTTLVGRARERAKETGIAEGQRWNEAIKAVQKSLERLVDRWHTRPVTTWCHGDLHPGNAMRRNGSPPGNGCVLIDLALVHPGHWVEDAVYLERLYWARPEMLCGLKPVSVIAKHLRDAQRLGAEDYTALANTRRALMAATVPLYMEHEGHPKYVHAALEVLERVLPVLGK